VGMQVWGQTQGREALAEQALTAVTPGACRGVAKPQYMAAAAAGGGI